MIAIDDWKLPIFQRGLTDAGFTFVVKSGLTPSTLSLHLDIPSAAMPELIAAVNKCQIKAAELKN